MQEIDIIEEQQTNQKHISALPSENVGQILRELSIVDRLQCEGVNPRWKAIVSDLGWTEQKKLSREIVFEGAKDQQKKKFNGESLIALFHCVGANLIELDLGSFTYLRLPISQHIFCSLELLPNLTKLNIKGVNFKEIVEFLPITLIELHSSGPFDDQGFRALSEKCPNLKVVFFVNYDHNEKVCIGDNMFFGKYPRMKTVHLMGNFVESELNVSLTSLGQLEWLEELHLFFVRAFDDVALTALATGSPRLRRLTLDRIPSVSEEAICKLDQHPNLLDFELKYLPKLNEDEQKAINQRWKIKKNNYFFSRMLSDDSVLREVLEELNSMRQTFQLDSTDDLIAFGFLPVLVKGLSSKNIELQCQATWMLHNITGGTSEQTGAVVEAGAVPGLLKLLGSESENVRENTLWALANIIGDRPEFRDLCPEFRGIYNGIVERLLEMAETEKSTVVLRQIAYTCKNISSVKTAPPSMDTIHAILSVSAKLIQGSDKDIMKDSILALVNFATHFENEQIQWIQCVVDLGVVPRLVSLLAHSDEQVQMAAIGAVAHIARGTDEQTQLLLDLGILKMLPALLRNVNFDKDTIWILSNVAAGTLDQLQALMDTGLVPVLIQFLVRPRDAQRQAVWAISNIAFRGNPDHIHYLVDHWVISPLCNLLEAGESHLCYDILDGLKNILEKSSARPGEVCEKIAQCGGLDKIKNLLNHDSDNVKRVAKEIVDEFFSPNDEK